MNLFLIENKKVPWGDWGDILWYGFAPYDYKSGKVYMERVGPFSPPLYFAGDSFLVTDEMKKSMENFGLTGIRFPYKVEKRKLVNIDWRSWNPQNCISTYIDDEYLFEPEAIIMEGTHDDSLSSIVQDYWLVEIENKVSIDINRNSKSKNPSDYLHINNEIDENIDFFEGIERLGCFVSQKMKNWLDENCPDLLESYLIAEKNKL